MNLNKQHSQSSAAIIYVIVSLFLALTQVIILPFVTDLLTAEQFGVYALATTIFGVIVVVAQLGMPNAYVVEFYKNKTERVQLLNEISGIYLFSIITIWILSFIAYTFDFCSFSKLPISFLVWILFASSFEIFFELFRITLRLERKALAYAIYILARFILANASFVIFLYMGLGAGELKFITMAAFTFGALTIYVFSNKLSAPNLALSNLKKKLFKFTLPIYPGLVLKVFLVSIDHFIVLYFLNLKALAIYALAVQLTWPINRFSASILDAFAPNIYETLASDGNQKSRYFFKQLAFFLILLNIICIPLIILPEIYVDMLVSSNNKHEILTIFLVIVVGRFFESLAPFFEIYFYHFQKTRIIGILSVLFLGILIILQAILIPLYGLPGAAYGYALARLIYIIILTLFIKKDFFKYSLRFLMLTSIIFLFITITYFSPNPIIRLSLVLVSLFFGYFFFKKELAEVFKKINIFSSKLKK